MFKNISITVFIKEYENMEFEVLKAFDDETKTTYKVLENEYVKGNIEIRKDNDSYIIYADIELIPYPYNYFRYFDSTKGFTVWVDAPSHFRGVGLKKFDPFWSTYAYVNDGKPAEGYVQNLLLEQNNDYTHYMPMSNESLNAFTSQDKFGKIGFSVRTNCCFDTKISGVIGMVCKSDSPHEAVKNNYKVASQNGIIKSKLKKQKTFPEIFEHFGWCTWDAFYHDVTAEKIEEKLKEFKGKNIPLKWVLIDDGWSQTENMRLNSFVEDRSKFPMGLKAFIRYIKEEYGVTYVGVWHSFTGYWFGVNPESELAVEQKNNLELSPSGFLTIGFECEKAYGFYSAWHKYLKECGVDFVKVDTQGSLAEIFKNTPNLCQRLINAHKALEKSVWENFDGNIINCMSMTNADCFAIADTAVMRNSGDFMPDKKGSFANHLMQNAVGAVFNDNLFYCDYDMWWSSHDNAKQSSVLRAISGGLVYVSDKLGKTDDEYIIPMIDEEGKILRCYGAAVPTKDCLFDDKSEDIMKIYNTAGDGYVVAAFNLSDTKKKVLITPDDFYEDGEFEAYYYFNEKTIYGSTFEIELEPDGVEIINLIRKDSVGFKNKEKYISIL